MNTTSRTNLHLLERLHDDAVMNGDEDAADFYSEEIEAMYADDVDLDA